MGDRDSDNVKVYNDLRNNVGMPALTPGMVTECGPSIARASAKNIRLAFNRVVTRIFGNGGKIDTYDSRLQWPALLNEIDGKNLGPGSIAHHAETAIFKCPTCGREREALAWWPPECRKCNVVMVTKQEGGP